MDAEATLCLWELVVGQTAWKRDDLLLTASDGGDPPRALGRRNARLMALHGRLFGGRLDLLSACPQCATTLEFCDDSDRLAEELAAMPVPGQTHLLEVDGHRVEFRVPDSDAIARAAQESTASFELSLLRHCVLASTSHGASVPADRLPAHVLDAISARMDALDPAATVSFDLECPGCSTRWSAPLDVGALIWSKVQAMAERLLLDVDTLARAYGWTERDVLSLNPMRRAAYLQLTTS